MDLTVTSKFELFLSMYAIFIRYNNTRSRCLVLWSIIWGPLIKILLTVVGQSAAVLVRYNVMEEVGYHRNTSIRMNSIKWSGMFAHHQVAKGVVAALLTCTRGTNVKMKALRTYENKRKTVNSVLASSCSITLWFPLMWPFKTNWNKCHFIPTLPFPVLCFSPVM